MPPGAFPPGADTAAVPVHIRSLRLANVLKFERNQGVISPLGRLPHAALERDKHNDYL